MSTSTVHSSTNGDGPEDQRMMLTITGELAATVLGPDNVPIAGPKSAALLKNGTLKAYEDFPHGMPTTHADTVNSDVPAFLKS
ncbi:hypothetical protein EB74_32105 [Mycobacterium sp. SWH-M5]|nr:hypothetical protein EB74_32105 [Mycobacterium sp. SWH-M5]